MKGLMHFLDKLRHPTDHQFEMMTKDEWHRDNQGNNVITKRTLVYACECGHVYKTKKIK